MELKVFDHDDESKVDWLDLKKKLVSECHHPLCCKILPKAALAISRNGKKVYFAKKIIRGRKSFNKVDLNDFSGTYLYIFRNWFIPILSLHFNFYFFFKI